VRPGRPNYGELIAAVSAILLFAFMFFDWYSVECDNANSPLLNLISFPPAGKSAWQALDYIPSVLLVTVFAALVTTALRISDVAEKLTRIHAAVAAFGVVSAALILIRILDAPNFNPGRGGWETLTCRSATQLPIYLALAAAVGIALGSFLAIEEERAS
jgi:hypothetical protein